MTSRRSRSSRGFEPGGCQKDAARRTVWLSGTVADFSKAFEVKLQQFDHPNGAYRGRTGPIHIPADLEDVVTAVLGLDNRPQAEPRFQILEESAGFADVRASGVSYSPCDVAKLYNFPAGADGSGQCIGIIELGGGYRPDDLRTYCRQLGLSLPNVLVVSVDGGHSRFIPSQSDMEVMLDVEVAGAVAPQAKIVVYSAANTDKGFLDAVSHAVHDDANNPSVLSISWGGPESNWTPQAMEVFDAALQDAAALGVTVCVAAGDRGSGDGVGDNRRMSISRPPAPSCWPAGGPGWQMARKSPGTTILSRVQPAAASTTNSACRTTSGTAHVPASVNPGGRVGRGVPDVAGDADPETGYRVRVNGVDQVIGGTSAVAPLWAGLIAILNQSLGTRLGFLNPPIYDSIGSSPAFHDITEGNNGDYHCGPGWDACTGWGSPNGTALRSALSGTGKRTTPMTTAATSDGQAPPACDDAYRQSVVQCYSVLVAGLASAKGDVDVQACRERFERGIQLCLEARQICMATCKEKTPDKP